jgi:regulator of sigma D
MGPVARSARINTTAVLIVLHEIKERFLLRGAKIEFCARLVDVFCNGHFHNLGPFSE